MALKDVSTLQTQLGEMMLSICFALGECGAAGS